jgi:hypothetical protein
VTTAARRLSPPLPGGDLPGVRRAVETDAAAHGVTPRVAWSLAAIPLAGGVAVLAAFVYRPLFIWILREDHPVEWLQFTLNWITAMVALMAAAGFLRRRQWLAALTFAVLGLGSFLLGGEEISWGQRAFAFTTPQDLMTDNDQGEFTFHNLDGAHGGFDLSALLRLVQVLIGLGGVLLPLAAAMPRSPLRRITFLRTVSPPLFLVPAFAMAFAIRLADLALRAVGHLPGAVIYYLEWGEFCLDLGLAGMAVCARAVYLDRTVHRFMLDPDDETAVLTPITTGVIIVVVTILAVTAGLAMMTMESGILPGNVKG